MGALQFADCPGFHAVLFRRTYPELSKADGLIPRSAQWLAGTGARWNGTDHTWRFPSGSTLSFSYLQRDSDKYKHQSAAYQYVGWDELTHFHKDEYDYLKTRIRRAAGE